MVSELWFKEVLGSSLVAPVIWHWTVFLRMFVHLSSMGVWAYSSYIFFSIHVRDRVAMTSVLAWFTLFAPFSNDYKFFESKWISSRLLWLRLVMLKSQAFFKLATKKVKIFWLFCFCGFTLGKIKQISKIRKAKKPTLIGFFAYFKQKSQKKS